MQVHRSDQSNPSMKSVKNTPRSPRLTRKLNEILIQNSNAEGELSPALEAGLKLFESVPKSREVSVCCDRNTLKAMIYYTENFSIMWTSETSLEPFLPILLLLGVDWAFAWDTGVEIEAALRAAEEAE